MPAFQAINLEPEENIDEQIDTTKELHVDDALKRFQTALRLHAQGPGSRDAAAVAYEELFDSEIFKYREARSEYESAEKQANGEVDSQALESFSAGLDVDAGGADGVAATLSLALYLGYKNYGEFFLDKLKDLRDSDPNWHHKLRILYRKDGGDKVLDYWAKALDQDPSDPEVWRRAARFAASMNSLRLKRYCLEAAIELDDDPAATEVEPPSLAEGLAGEQLKQQLEILGDKIALSHPILGAWTMKEMPEFMKRHIDPMPFLPDPTQTLTPPPSSPATERQQLLDGDEEGSERDAVVETISSWIELGQELVKHINDPTPPTLNCELELDLPSSDPKLQKPESGDTDQENGPESSTRESDAQTKPDVGNRRRTRNTKEPETQVEKEAPEKGSDKKEDKNERSNSAPTTRKRSQSVAGLPEVADEDSVREKRSKRVRRRETTGAEESTSAGASIANQLQPFQEADQNLFRATKNILENLGVEDKDAISRLTELQDLPTSEDRMASLTPMATKDLRTVISGFTEETVRVLLNKEEKPPLGLSSFLEHANSGSQDQSTTTPFNETKGVKTFVEKMKEAHSWMTGGDVAFEWVKAVSKTYATEKWPDEMKTTVVQMLTQGHAGLFDRVTSEIDLHQGSLGHLEELGALVMMLFELHVDVYDRITNPSSVVDYSTRLETKDRLARWLNVASTYATLLDRPASDPLCVRFMWGSVLMASHAEDPVREHILMMWTSLRDFLTDEKVEPLLLPNNAVMPVLSAEAADREISKLTTMDFFLGLFQDEMEDPLHVIETLEPVLNPSSVRVATGDSPSPDSDESTEEPINPGRPISECAGQGLRDLWKFLQSSSTELRLFLWSQLGFAYDAIDYKTKTFSCHLRCIEMIVDDLEGETYMKTPQDSRRLLLLRTLKSLDDQLVQALSMSLNEPTAFDIIDEEHIKTSTAALAKINCLLHVAALYEDEIRVGIASSGSSQSTFQSMTNKLREMQVRAWTLQYTLIDAAISQQGSFISPDTERADYLAAIHQVIGLRKFCKVSNKIFLNLMRRELLKMKDPDHWEEYLEQILYDLYGLKLGVSTWGVQEHGSQHETLQKAKTIQLVERVMVLANRMSVKDLLKSELRTTIDHMQQTIGQLKSNAQMIHNLRNFTEYLKKPIHPLKLYRALSGSVDLDAVTVPPHSDAVLANYGWFFLLGMIALTKFKGVDLNRRQTPGATDDLRIGATFLRLQLQFTPDRWDAWFRLAECFDHELDEAVLWTAEKINKDRSELLKFQRHAIHCYSLALSHSRNVDVETYEGDPLHDLYHRFGMRMYSSSREPFAMEPFKHSEQERFFIEASGQGTFKRIVHDEMTTYKVWKYAARLFRMAMKRQPANWKNPYMLTKCYWKMFKTDSSELDKTDRRSPVDAQMVLDAIKKSVDAAYNARKSRKSEPILEPHYKIVSIVHKMVMRGDLQAKEAAPIIAEQPFGVPIEEDDDFASFAEPEHWEEYMIANLEKLADKDKSNWQHRIIMRHASILFDESKIEDGGKSQGTEKNSQGATDKDQAGDQNQDTDKDSGGNKELEGEKDQESKKNEDTDMNQPDDKSEDVVKEENTSMSQDNDNGENNDEAFSAAKEAFDILSDSMLTKTMVMNVWKCEAERPGRHHVYTERYTRFVVRLLSIMSDRANMEQLLKRIRKKGADFYHFLDLWQWCCHEFVKLLRRIYKIPEATEEVFKSMSMEEFEIISGRITDWAAIDGPPTAAFGCMRDVIELKKLNGGLTRAGPIDDLINDCYSKIYLDVRDSLPGVEPAKLIEEERKRAREAAEAEAEAAAAGEGEQKATNALHSLLNPADGQDSLRTTPAPQESEKPEAAHRARRTGIRRPDVLRKAEQAVMRSMEPKATTTKGRLGSMSSKRGSQTPAAAMSEDGSDEEGADAQVRREAEEGGDTKMRDAGSGVQDAPLGSDGESLQENDGDDESDLSDAPEASDEEIPPGLVFPSIHPDDETAEASGEEADGENDNDDSSDEADETGDVTVGEDADGDDAAEGDGEEDKEGEEVDDEVVEDDEAEAEEVEGEVDEEDVGEDIEDAEEGDNVEVEEEEEDEEEGEGEGEEEEEDEEGEEEEAGDEEEGGEEEEDEEVEDEEEEDEQDGDMEVDDADEEPGNPEDGAEKDTEMQES